MPGPFNQDGKLLVFVSVQKVIWTASTTITKYSWYLEIFVFCLKILKAKTNDNIIPLQATVTPGPVLYIKALKQDHTR